MDTGGKCFSCKGLDRMDAVLIYPVPLVKVSKAALRARKARTFSP